MNKYQLSRKYPIGTFIEPKILNELSSEEEDKIVGNGIGYFACPFIIKVLGYDVLGNGENVLYCERVFKKGHLHHGQRCCVHPLEVKRTFPKDSKLNLSYKGELLDEVVKTQRKKS